MYLNHILLDIYSSSIHKVDFHVSIQYLLLRKSGILGAFYNADGPSNRDARRGDVTYLIGRSEIKRRNKPNSIYKKKKSKHYIPKERFEIPAEINRGKGKSLDKPHSGLSHPATPLTSKRKAINPTLNEPKKTEKLDCW